MVLILLPQGAKCLVLGCTEIELLVQQSHIPELLVLPSGELHIAAVVNIQLGNTQLSDYLPTRQ